MAVLAYEGAGRELVARLKYRNFRASVPRLAAAMASAVGASAFGASAVDVVTWVPTTRQRRRARGFDQAELLARAVARQLQRPCRCLLLRSGGAAQTGQALAARRIGPDFTARRRCPRRVLLVDDVITTGATVTAAASALRRAGSTEVHVVAAARTPRRKSEPAA